MDPALEETARSLGLGAWRTFSRVVLPQLRPALLGGLLLVALDALVEFDAFVALKYQTFTLNIYAQYQISFSASGAAALSFFSIVLCLVVLLVESRLRGGANYTRLSHGVRRGAVRYELGRRQTGGPRRAGRYWSRSASASPSACSSTGSPRAAARRCRVPRQTCSTCGPPPSPRSCSGSAPPSWPSSSPCRWPSWRCATTAGSRPLLERSVVPVLRAARPRGRRSRSPTPRATTCGLLYGSVALLVLAEAMLFVPFAVVALRSHPRADRAGHGGVGALARPRAPAHALESHGAARAARTRRGRRARVRLRRSATSPPRRCCCRRACTPSAPQFWANSRTVAFAAAAPYGAVLIVLALAATYVLMSRFGRTRALREGPEVAELRCAGRGQVLRSPSRADRRRPPRPRGHAHRHPRGVGERQDDPARLIIGFIAPDEGRIEVGGAVVADAGAVSTSRPSDRADRLRRAGGRALPAPRRSPRTSASACHARERKAGRGSTRCSPWSGLGRDYAGRRAPRALGRRAAPRGPGESPRPAPAAGAAGRAVLGARRSPAGRDARGGAPCARRGGERPPCSSPTTRRRRSPWGGRWRSSATGGSSRPRRRPASTRAPADLDVARFVGEAVVIPGQAAHGLVQCALGNAADRPTASCARAPSTS